MRAKITNRFVIVLYPENGAEEAILSVAANHGVYLSASGHCDGKLTDIAISPNGKWESGGEEKSSE